MLLYAVNSDSVHHEASRRWLDESLSGSDRVGFAWVPLLAIIRLTTHPGLFPRPLSAEAALTQVSLWLSSASAVLASPTPRHTDVLALLLREVGGGGNLVDDAHLAALALEHRASVVSYDRDFGRFTGVRWDRPDDLC